MRSLRHYPLTLDEQHVNIGERGREREGRGRDGGGCVGVTDIEGFLPRGRKEESVSVCEGRGRENREVGFVCCA